MAGFFGVSDSGAAFRERLRLLQTEMARLVIDECEHQRRKHRELWALPVEERENRGQCVRGLRFCGMPQEALLEFEVTRNLSNFREDDLLLLNRGQPALTGGLDVTLYRETDDRLFLRLQKPNLNIDWSGEWTLDLNFIDLEKLYLQAIEAVGQTEVGRERILPLLGGELPATIDLEAFDSACEEAEAAGHDDSQVEAIAAAAAADVCCLVQGPPGTGKTRALAQTVRQRAARGERILVTSFTHRAIHNALNAIEASDPGCPVAKVGWPVWDPELRVAQYEAFSKLPFARSASGYVIGATPFSLRSKRLRNVEFDTIVFDEASQITLPLATMAMLGGKTYLFFGDTKQLPPVLQTIDADVAHSYSIFNRLHGRAPLRMLETTYRLNAELTAWPSENFYSGMLAAHPDNAARRLPLQHVPSAHREILDPSAPSVYVEMPDADDRVVSTEEALLVVELLEEIFRCGISLGNAGVVTPYRRQARTIRQLLRNRKRIPQEEVKRCVIDTVERMQGQERELIICSLAASDPEFIVRQQDFLYQAQRLNVTATRARSKFILLASKSFLTAESLDSDFQERKAVLRSLRDASKQIRWNPSVGEVTMGN